MKEKHDSATGNTKDKSENKYTAKHYVVHQHCIQKIFYLFPVISTSTKKCVKIFASEARERAERSGEIAEHHVAIISHARFVHLMKRFVFFEA